jgi:hypothetical protein
MVKDKLDLSCLVYLFFIRLIAQPAKKISKEEIRDCRRMAQITFSTSTESKKND